MYSIVIIQFKDWEEYIEEVNKLCSKGIVIDETIDKTSYGYGIKNEHTLRLKSINK